MKKGLKIMQDIEYKISDLHRIFSKICLAPEEQKKQKENFVRFKDGYIFSDGGIILADIKSIRVAQKDEKPFVVIVKFTDGKIEKAFLQEGDTFSLEQGISICLAKKLLSEYTEHETAVYNKIMKHAFEIYESGKQTDKKSNFEVAENKDVPKEPVEAL